MNYESDTYAVQALQGKNNFYIKFDNFRIIINKQMLLEISNNLTIWLS